jgi:hypothetical protein
MPATGRYTREKSQHCSMKAQRCGSIAIRQRAEWARTGRGGMITTPVDGSGAVSLVFP